MHFGHMSCRFQVLPLIVHNLVDKELTKLVCKACAVAMRIYTRRLPEHYTDEDLQAIDADILQLRDALRKLYGSSVNLNCPKFHKLSHLTDDIRRLGHPKHYNSDLYEAAHVILKRLYECVQLLLPV
jgi:hypothetical protein